MFLMIFLKHPEKPAKIMASCREQILEAKIAHYKMKGRNAEILCMFT